MCIRQIFKKLLIRVKAFLMRIYLEQNKDIICDDQDTSDWEIY